MNTVGCEIVMQCLQGWIWDNQSDTDSDLDPLSDAEVLTRHI